MLQKIHIHTINARFLPSGLLISVFQEIVSQFFKLFLKLGGGYEVKIELPRRLGHTQRYVIASNHQSMLDPFAIFALLNLRRRFEILPLKFMTIPKVYHRIWVKPFAYLLGCFPAHIKERKHHTYGVDGSLKLLNYGYNIVIFPEGTRTLEKDSDPRPGVSRILNGRPDAKLLLVRLQWTPGKLWARHLTMVITEAPKNINKNDPKAIMDAIYAL